YLGGVGQQCHDRQPRRGTGGGRLPGRAPPAGGHRGADLPGLCLHRRFRTQRDPSRRDGDRSGGGLPARGRHLTGGGAVRDGEPAAAFVPVLATSVGFVLSVVSTTAIMFVVPILLRRLAVHLPLLPSVLVAALIVPFVAQLACTPVLVAIDPRIGLWSVAA